MIFRDWIETQEATRWNLDEASIEAITDHFSEREICDEEKMSLFFWRTLGIWREKYKALVRVESIQFDPLVNRYFESQTIAKEVTEDSATESRTGEHSNQNTASQLAENNRVRQDTDNETNNITKAGTKQGSKSGEFSEALTGSKSGSDDISNSGSSGTTTQTNENGTDSTVTHGETSTDRINKNARKDTPMSAVNASGTGGKLGALDFTYASGYAQDENSETGESDGTENVNHTANSTTTVNGTTNNSETHRTSESERQSKEGSNSEEFSESDNGTERAEKRGTLNSVDNSTESNTAQGSDSGTSSEEVEHTGSKEQNSDRTNRYTGRAGLTPQEAMAKASDYLMNYSPAMAWLCRKLEICFIGVYDI